MLFPSLENTVKNWFFHHENVRGGSVGQLLKFCEKAVYDRLKERVSLREAFEVYLSVQVENKQLGIQNTQNDFIDMFLDYYSENIEDSVYGGTVEKKVTAEDVVGSCYLFLLAGFDTTANSLAYASYLLALNPEKMRLAQEEIDEVCTSEHISYDDLTKLKYLDGVVREALRLYPVAWFACSRECVKATTLGGIHIDVGVKVEADVTALHRSPEIWGNDAEKFVPER